MALPRALGRLLGRYHPPTIGDAVLVVSKGCASEGSTLGFLAKTTLAIPNGQVAVGSRNEILLRECGWFAMNVGLFGFCLVLRSLSQWDGHLRASYRP